MTEWTIVPDPGDIKVVLLPADMTGCGMQRMILPGEIMRKAGHDITINFPMKRNNWPIDIEFVNGGDPALPVRWRPVEDVIVHGDVDLIVFQRPNSRRLYDAFGILQSKGIAVAVDVDDALWSIDKSNSASRSWEADRDHNWRWMLKCARRADVFTVTTKALADKAGTGVVLPNYLPAQIIADEPKSHPVERVGWAAGLNTHPNDPAVTNGMVREAVAATGVQFWSLGGLDPEVEAFGFGDDDLGEIAFSSGPVPYERWHRSLFHLDVSLVPLADTLFNKAKSALKMLESAAQGCTVIASPTPDNLRIATGHGFGLIAKSPQQWMRMILRLVKDERLFVEQSEAGLATARDNTYEQHSYRWMEAWSSAVSTRRRHNKKVTA